MEETYTFSRALHMMRYGGKKMRAIGEYRSDQYLFIENGELMGVIGDTKFFLETLRLGEKIISDLFLSGSMIMGSWVEVKDAN